MLISSSPLLELRMHSDSAQGQPNLKGINDSQLQASDETQDSPSMLGVLQKGFLRLGTLPGAACARRSVELGVADRCPSPAVLRSIAAPPRSASRGQAPCGARHSECHLIGAGLTGSDKPICLLWSPCLCTAASLE